MTLRLAFPIGGTPDKWVRRWRDQTREPIEVELVDDPMAVLADFDMVLVRSVEPLPRDDHHVIALYDEDTVAVVSKDNVLSLAEGLVAADLVDESVFWGSELIDRSPDVFEHPPRHEKDAIAAAAAGSGAAIVPLSVARALHRKDVVPVEVTDARRTHMSLVWLKSADSDKHQRFVGVVRGRTRNSSRG